MSRRTSQRVGDAFFIWQFTVISFVISKHHVHDEAGEKDDHCRKQNRKPQGNQRNHSDSYSSGDPNVKQRSAMGENGELIITMRVVASWKATAEGLEPGFATAVISCKRDTHCGAGWRVRLSRLPNSITKTPPPPAIAACIVQNAAGLIFS